MNDMTTYLLREFQERMDALAAAVSHGACGSYEEYKYTCGQLRGLEAACGVVKDLQTRMEKMDD